MQNDLSPWEQGYEAWYARRDLSDNPYPEGTDAHWQWDDGFTTADEYSELRL